MFFFNDDSKISTKKGGLTKLIEPIGSVSLNRSLVGETEELIQSIILRGTYLPFLLCCVCIDEIDALVPKRDLSNQGSSKVDTLTTFITMIGGITNVPNVYIIGATNRFNKIDEAFLRRMHHQIYIGNMSIDQRLRFIQSVCDFDFGNDEVINKLADLRTSESLASLIKVLTTSFSGSATAGLRDSLINYFENTCNAKKLGLIKLSDLIKELCDDIAQANNIKFCGKTIRELYSNNCEHLMNFWKNNCDCLKNATGRVLIDLNQDALKMQFELKNNTVYEINLKNLIADLKMFNQIVPLVFNMCIYLNIDYVKFIDTSFLQLKGSGGQNSKLDAILECFVDYEEYANGLIMFDEDSVIGVQSAGNEEALMKDGSLNQSMKGLLILLFCVNVKGQN